MFVWPVAEGFAAPQHGLPLVLISSLVWQPWFPPGDRKGEFTSPGSVRILLTLAFALTGSCLSNEQLIKLGFRRQPIFQFMSTFKGSALRTQIRRLCNHRMSLRVGMSHNSTEAQRIDVVAL